MQSPRKRKASSSSSLSSSAAEAGGKVVVLGWNSPINQRRRPDVIRFRAYGNIFLIIWTSVIFLHHFEIRQDFYLCLLSIVACNPSKKYLVVQSLHVIPPSIQKDSACVCMCVCRPKYMRLCVFVFSVVRPSNDRRLQSNYGPNFMVSCERESVRNFYQNLRVFPAVTEVAGYISR